MSEIDTSAAAIELIKARRAIYDRTRALADIDTLLAALAERDETIRIMCTQVSEVEAKLAAHDAFLTQVREEMPEVEAAGDYFESWDPCNTMTHVNALFKVINQFKQNQARWRNARDVCDAERKRLQDQAVEYRQEIRKLERELEHFQEACKSTGHASIALQQQLSASNEAQRELASKLADANAACAELHERLARSEDNIRWLLPMAKGWAAANPVGANQQICNDAQEYLAVADSKQREQT